MLEIDGKQLGLALGGGATLGAVHVGVLRALEEAGLRPSFVTGTSIGAVVGALYVCGVSVARIEEIAFEMNWLDVAGLTLSRMGLLDHTKLGKLLREHIDEPSFQDTNVPFAVVATDIEAGQGVVMREGDLVSAVLASACLPGLFVPIRRDGRLLVDGGLVDNLPVAPLRELGAEFVIASDLMHADRLARVKSLVDVLVNTMRVMMAVGGNRGSGVADVHVAPDLSSYSSVNTKASKALVRIGYEAMQAALAVPR